MIARWSRSERGSAAAEFAVALPAVILMLALIMGVISAQGTQIMLQDAAADAARLIARQDDQARAERLLDDAVRGAVLVVEQRDDLLCVEVLATVTIVVAVNLTARACALSGGE